ncbi:MAG TPA: hypothetical protein VK825_15110 [Xanthobacteraceae bacterium]|jgi:hypothetical protein|nr:hypothetical protein [Xanthobacteraceae bacterium]
MSFTVLLYTGDDGTDEGTPEREWRTKIGKAQPFPDGSRSSINGVGAALPRLIVAIVPAMAGISLPIGASWVGIGG